MNNSANGRLAVIVVAAAVAVAAFIAKPASACTPAQCPSNNSDLQGVPANALPTYPEPAAEAAAEPVKLKKFTKQATRTAKRSPRKAQLAQRAHAGRLAAARKARQDEAAARATISARKVSPTFVNANAELVETDAAKASAYASPFDKPAPANAAEPSQATAETPATPIELVAADEFNDLDRAAWDANQMPKLMQLKATSGDSRAELRDDDSRWAQTSTIGKIFVAFGALLTLGSAIRMFMA